MIPRHQQRDKNKDLKGGECWSATTDKLNMLFGQLKRKFKLKRSNGTCNLIYARCTHIQIIFYLLLINSSNMCQRAYTQLRSYINWLECLDIIKFSDFFVVNYAQTQFKYYEASCTYPWWSILLYLTRLVEQVFNISFSFSWK